MTSPFNWKGASSFASDRAFNGRNLKQSIKSSRMDKISPASHLRGNPTRTEAELQMKKDKKHE